MTHRRAMIGLGVALSLGIGQMALAKAHVRLTGGQVCLNGRTIQVSEKAIDALIAKIGACELPACDFNNVFLRGDACSSEANSDGMCLLTNPRDGADGATDACPAGKY